MKAVLVIEMPEGENIDDYYAKSILLTHKDGVEYPYYKTGLEIMDVSLTPLPNKLEPWQFADKFETWKMPQKTIDSMAVGYNKCIDEITGEAE